MNSQDYYAIGRALARTSIDRFDANSAALRIEEENRHSFKKGRPYNMIMAAYEECRKKIAEGAL